MSRAVSPATGRPYGVLRVTRLRGVARATVCRRRRRPPEAIERGRPGPRGAMPDDARVAGIRGVPKAGPFHGEGYPQGLGPAALPGHPDVDAPRAAPDGGARAARAAAHRPTARPRGPRWKAHDGTIGTERVDVVWGADLTSVVTDEGVASVVVAVDHGPTECVGLQAARRATRFEALEPIRRGVRERLGAFAQDVAGGLTLRHDRGSRYVAHDFRAEIAFLGITSPPAVAREPEGILGLDPRTSAERFIRTPKEHPLRVRRFAPVEELRRAPLDRRRRYDDTWIVERHGYRTPAQVRADQVGALAAAA